jgi:FKBP-type peptidyl-prolyl cis-trans isomerase
MSFKSLAATGLALVVASPLAQAQAPKAVTSPAPAQAKAAAPAADPASNAKDASYVIGLNIGQNLKAQDIGLDVEQLLQGLKDGLTGVKPRLDEAQQQQAVAAFSQRVDAKKQQEAQAMATKNISAGKAFLEENKKKPNVKTTASGLQYEVLKPGTGPSPKSTDTVKVNYTGTTIDGKVFDSTDQHGEPAIFPLDRVIAGWTEGIPLMKVGGKTRFVLPPELGYGASPPPGAAFGPNAVLVFEVELLGIEK